MGLHELWKHLALLLISFISNCISALAGGGAGLLQLPALILFGFPFPIALATHKLASVALGIGATFRYSKEKNLNARFAFFILTFGIPGVLIGANIVLRLSGELLTLLLGVLTLGLVIYSRTNKTLYTRELTFDFLSPRMLFGGLVLFLIGFLNGSLSSGTGLFVTLWLVRWFGLDYRLSITYTLILVGLFWNGIGALALGLQGQIALNWLPVLLIGSVSGGYFGAHIAISTSSNVIKIVFEVVALLMGISLIVRSL